MSDLTVIRLLAALPNQKINGKKRLQKLAHLLKLAGADVGEDFSISHFGPYSRRLADSAELLSLIGEIDKKIRPTGVYGTYLSEYSLPSNTLLEHKFQEKFERIASEIDRYSTVELEVASTIGFFVDAGFSEDRAIEQTKSMKPTKAKPPVLLKAEKILAAVRASN